MLPVDQPRGERLTLGGDEFIVRAVVRGHRRCALRGRDADAARRRTAGDAPPRSRRGVLRARGRVHLLHRTGAGQRPSADRSSRRRRAARRPDAPHRSQRVGRRRGGVRRACAGCADGELLAGGRRPGGRWRPEHGASAGGGGGERHRAVWVRSRPRRPERSGVVAGGQTAPPSSAYEATDQPDQTQDQAAGHPRQTHGGHGQHQQRQEPRTEVGQPGDAEVAAAEPGQSGEHRAGQHPGQTADQGWSRRTAQRVGPAPPRAPPRHPRAPHRPATTTGRRRPGPSPGSAPNTGTAGNAPSSVPAGATRVVGPRLNPAPRV